jgi:hypothetical protein
MSALHLPRLVFSGDFQADVSTVNNDVRHYDTGTFETRFQQPQTGPSLDGWFNPSGSGAFRLVDCVVRSALREDGAGAGDDPVLTSSVTGAASRVSGKLVDLDPQWQMSSEIWGLGVRLADSDGTTLLEGAFEPAPFRDIMFGRQSSNPNGQTASAVYTSRLSGVVSLAPGRSEFLDALLATSDDGELAIRLTTFGYFSNSRHSRFTLGRLLGAIGPVRSGEPRRFVLGRRLAPADGDATVERLNFADAVVSPAGGRVSLDLGNVLPLTDPFGATADVGPLALAVLRTPDGPDGTPGAREGDVLASADVLVLGSVDYRAPDWLVRTAGIVDLTLDDAAGLIADHPLALVTQDGATARVVLRETVGGLLVRADDVVLRVDAREDRPVHATARCHAVRWGVPLPSAAIRTELAPPMPGLGGGPPADPAPPPAPIPEIGRPPGAVELSEEVVTGADGSAEIRLTVHDPGRPRGYLDGQIYLVTYLLEGQPPVQQHQLDLVVLHVRDAYNPPARPTWVDDVRPLFAQYGNLYPIMSHRLVDLGDYDAVREHAAVIELAFSQALGDPNHMPVTRELPETRRAMLLSWLRDRNGYGERRLLHGPRTPTGRNRTGRAGVPATTPPGGNGSGVDEVGEIGGKAVAMPQVLGQLLRIPGRGRGVTPSPGSPTGSGS